MKKTALYIPKKLEHARFSLLLVPLLGLKKTRHRAGYYSFFSNLGTKKSSRLKTNISKYLGYIALFAMTVPLPLFALGLGKIRVFSALNQPFHAEIKLIDAGSVSLSRINVALASPENFRRLGLEPFAASGLLFFELNYNEQGQPVVLIYSKERITQPYMQIVLDLAWPKGQLYKAYTVLLDPPGYKLDQLSTSTEDASFDSKDGKEKKVYGPTAAKENVWQIAQKYKTADAILPQVVLAIIGTNPNAFNENNLNGLKVGVCLDIPSDKEIQQVPADLATVEVMAHDKAWNEKTSINHVLSPPYTQSVTRQKTSLASILDNSQLPAVPKFFNAAQTLLVSSLPSLQKPLGSTPDSGGLIPAHPSVGSVQDANSLLTEQVHLVQIQNKKLQEEFDRWGQELHLMRQQIEFIMNQRLSFAPQTSASVLDNPLAKLFLLIVTTTVVLLIFGYCQRQKQKKNSFFAEELGELKPEPKLDHEVKDSVLKEKTQGDKFRVTEAREEVAVSNQPFSTDIPEQAKDQVSLLKNTKALNTLLALAKTYIGMDDIESALHSLEEVMAHGNKAQKKEAKSLLDQLKR